MEKEYAGKAAGYFEVDGVCAAFVGLDAAAKAADVSIEAVERTRRNCFVCVKLRGSVSDVEAAMQAALLAAGKIAALGNHGIIASPEEGTEEVLKLTNI
ncbi:MAG: BMC domain-containing protein [Lachnospiraceae bacterium]